VSTTGGGVCDRRHLITIQTPCNLGGKSVSIVVFEPLNDYVYARGNCWRCLRSAREQGHRAAKCLSVYLRPIGWLESSPHGDRCA
jgi:hypothetical protein